MNILSLNNVILIGNICFQMIFFRENKSIFCLLFSRARQINFTRNANMPQVIYMYDSSLFFSSYLMVCSFIHIIPLSIWRCVSLFGDASLYLEMISLFLEIFLGFIRDDHDGFCDEIFLSHIQWELFTSGHFFLETLNTQLISPLVNISYRRQYIISVNVFRRYPTGKNAFYKIIAVLYPFLNGCEKIKSHLMWSK